MITTDKYIFQNKFELRYFDYFTNRIFKRNRYKIDNKNLIKLIISGFYIMKININPNDLKFLIEKITSCKYGKNQSNKNDILKISFEKQENYFEEFNDESIYTLGIYDPDSEVDVEMKYFVNKYHNSLSEEEQLIFIKYFYEEVSFSGMIENNFVKNDYLGFSVEKSIQRSIDWKSVLGKNKELSSKIGTLSFWKQTLEKFGLSNNQKFKVN